jgi:hypothetical protein
MKEKKERKQTPKRVALKGRGVPREQKLPTRQPPTSKGSPLRGDQDEGGEIGWRAGGCGATRGRGERPGGVGKS